MGFQNKNKKRRVKIADKAEMKDYPNAQVLEEDWDGGILIECLEPIKHVDIEDLEVGDLQIKLPKHAPYMVDRNKNKFRPLEIHLFQGKDKNGRDQYHVTCVYIKQVNVPDQVQVPDPASDPNDVQMITKSITTPKLVCNIAPDYENENRSTTPAAAAAAPGTPGAEPQG